MVNNESEGAWKPVLMPVSLETLKGSEGVKIEEEGAWKPAASDPLIGVGLKESASAFVRWPDWNITQTWNQN